MPREKQEVVTEMTEFSCRMCGASVTFSLDDPNSYEQKSESGNPLIGHLFTVRVAHETPSNAVHVNVVVVDERGEYRAHKDCYEEKSGPSAAARRSDTVLAQLPMEIRSYLSLASQEDLKVMNAVEQQSTATPVDTLAALDQLRRANPNSRLLEFLWAKWAFITGRMDLLSSFHVSRESWVYPLILRVRARSSDRSVLEDAKTLDMSKEDELIQFEVIMAKAEVFTRLAAFELLEDMYQSSVNRYKSHPSIAAKTALLVAQSYYGFGLLRQGKMTASRDMIEPAFTFAQIVGNREMLTLIGNMYSSVLRKLGDLRQALLVLEVGLDAAKSLQEERAKVIFAINMAIILTVQGKFEEALALQQEAYANPVTQSEFYLKVTLQNNISESLLELRRYEDARRMAQEALAQEGVATDLRVSLLTILKAVAGNTQSRTLLKWLRQNVPGGQFMATPQGKLFIQDLDAIQLELDRNWEALALNLENQLKITTEHKMSENAKDLELRAAEAYFSLYTNTRRPEHLSAVYRHLDLVRTLALEADYYPEMCRLSIMKGMIALHSGVRDRAKAHFEEALRLAEEYNFEALQEQAREQLETLRSQAGPRESESTIRSMFRRFASRRSQERTVVPPATVLAMWLSDSRHSFEHLFTDPSIASDTHGAYIQGVADTWRMMRAEDETESFTGKTGSVVVERSEGFLAIALCNRPGYLVQKSLQALLSKLEAFSLKSVPEETSAHALSLVLSEFPSLKERTRT
ncbi:MAG: tetratricopeptide repeat protein [Candidatus Thorarchaeota archaeon]|nr:tetratricopeptide repeat protein [Candidatus Thorarchaeota archaeon]